MTNTGRLTLIGLLSLLVVAASVIVLSAQEDEEETTEPAQVITEADIERPEWQTVELTDVNSGEVFTLGDFYGQTVFVEPMATWCSNCRRQLQEVSQVIDMFNSEAPDDAPQAPTDVVFIALSLETNLSDSQLAAYTAAQGFDWTFAVMSEDLLIALVDEFGRSLANAPSSPHFIIRPDGTFTDLATGFEDAEDLIAELAQAEVDSAPTLREAVAPEGTPEAEATPEVGVSAETVSNRPAWQTIELSDARTGEPFTLAQFSGQTVFVEPMATWCSNCRSQLQNVAEARAELEGEDVVFIALSLEVQLDPTELADYADSQGFDWTFAVMNEDLLVALVDAFGRAVTTAPSTPHIIIRPDGSFTELATGLESADEIVEEIKAAQES